MPSRQQPLLLFVVLVAALALLVSVGPAERTLGTSARVVYLHGAWVWTALAGFGAAALVGAAGLALRRSGTQRWSIALGQAAAFFWVTYLPLGLWAMQLHWNGLFLEEPRWRVGFDFAIVAVLLQAAILLLAKPSWGSALNISYFVALVWSLARTREVMHPSSPILNSQSLVIHAFFFLLLAACLVAGWQLARWLRLLHP